VIIAASLYKWNNGKANELNTIFVTTTRIAIGLGSKKIELVKIILVLVKNHLQHPGAVLEVFVMTLVIMYVPLGRQTLLDGLLNTI